MGTIEIDGDHPRVLPRAPASAVPADDLLPRASPHALPSLVVRSSRNDATIGPPSNLPAGWFVCDGTNGTPDLRDNFILGAGLTYALGANGSVTDTTGAETAPIVPTINAVTLSVPNLPAHAHPFDYFVGNSASIFDPGAGPGTVFFAQDSGGGTRIGYAGSNTGSGTAFTPTAPALPTHVHNFSIGPFYALYFAMYTGA